MDRGPYWGYFPEPVKSLFILDTPVQEVVAGIEFEAEELALNFVSGSRYLGAYLVPQEELAEWVKPQAEAWTHCVSVFGKNLDGARSRLTLAWGCRCNLSGSTRKGLSPELAFLWVPLRRP